MRTATVQTQDVDFAAEHLRRLILEAKAEKGWTWNQVHGAVERAFPTGGMSARTIQEYASPRRTTKPNPATVRKIAKVFEANPEEWLRRCGFEKTSDLSILSPPEETLERQRNLPQDSQVYVITCGDLLEQSNPSVLDLVVGNLRKGVVYKYFYPVTREGQQGAAGSPFGSEAATSYRCFRCDTLRGHHFENAPLVFGFGVDPARFAYFSKLHAIVYFSRPGNQGDEMHAWVEHETPADPDARTRVGSYQIPREVMGKILRHLDAARDAISDLGVPFVPMNERLRELSQDRNAGKSQIGGGSKVYRLVRNMTHRASFCVDQILRRSDAFRLPRTEEIRFLDIGCGKGEVTAEIARELGERHPDHQVSVTVLEPLCASAEEAERRFKEHGISAEVRHDTFEEVTFGETRFHLIASVHSFYTIDEVYLRKVYDLLEVGGVACLWIGDLKDNVVNQMRDGLDRLVYGGRTRNYGEHLVRCLELMGLEARGRLQHSCMKDQIELLVEEEHLTQVGEEIASFLSPTGKLEGKARDMATEAAENTVTRASEGSLVHPVYERLIVFQRLDE